jgi:hypothetical protein
MPTEAQTIIRVCTCVSMDTQRLPFIDDGTCN